MREVTPLEQLELKDYLDSIDEPLDRAVIILVLKWGFSAEEIGELFSINSPHLLISRLLDKLSN